MQDSQNAKIKYVQDIHVLLGSCYDFFTTLHGFHWNIEGSSFFDLHAFFQKEYESLHDFMDECAERLRALDVYAPGTLVEMKSLSSLPSVEKNASSHKMVEVFCEHTRLLAEHAKNLIPLCEKQHDFATQDILIRFITVLEKSVWIAQSYRK